MEGDQGRAAVPAAGPSSSSPPPPPPPSSKKQKLSVRWGRKSFTVEFEAPERETLYDLRRKIECETQVKPKRQKLVGFAGVSNSVVNKPGGLSEEEEKAVTIETLMKGVKPGKSIMMIGSVEKVLESQRKEEDLKLRMQDQVVDDFDIGEGDEQAIKVHLKSENLEKVRRRVEQAKIKMIEGNAPREGKKLLVLDIDYTLFDHRSTAETPEELRRPYLLEFLTEVYRYYDIVIWSATSMKWIEVKMKELGVMEESCEFKILAFMDYTAMISVTTEKYGTIDCKPLGVLWSHESFNGKYSAENTIMFDDLRRNFCMNPRNGLKIRPFKQAHQSRHTDRELMKLSVYLRAIRKVKDLSKIDHRKWESLMRKWNLSEWNASFGDSTT
mmetsp:Transcript_8657/g.16041  ORF Transcript_8657/g.16041 Transcript_8657/m.16041 type:complete len:384 (+) Transcript_8657:83-1234(+)